MKKIIVIILILVGLGGGGYYAYQMMSTASDINMEDVLPAEAIVYMRLDDVESSLSEFTGTPLWQAFSQLPYEDMFDAIKQPQLKVFSDMVNQWSSDPQVQTVFDRFFSEQVAIAMYAPTQSLDQINIQDINNLPQLLDIVFPHIYVATRVKADVQIAELFSRSFKNMGSNMEKSSEEYKGYTIQSLEDGESGLLVTYVRFQDILVLGVGVESIQKSIDAFLQDEKALDNDHMLQEAFAQHDSNADFWLGWNWKKTFEVSEVFMRKMMLPEIRSPEANQQLDEYFQNLKGFKHVSTTAHWGVLTKIFTHFDINRNALKGSLLAYYQNCDSMKNQSVQFIPSSVLFYQWSACLDLQAYWDPIVESMNDEDAQILKSQVAMYESMLGSSIEGDLIPALGDEWGFYIEEIQQVMGFPLPTAALFIEVTNQKVISDLMGHLAQNPMVQLQQEDYNKATIHFVVSPFPAVQPGYAFIDGYFIFAVNKTLLKKSIDAYQDKGQSLMSKATFAKLDAGLLKPSISVFYVEVDSMIDQLSSVVQWSKKFLAQKDNQRDALRSGAEARLENAQNRFEEEQVTLEEVQENMILVDSRIWNLEQQGLDTSEVQQELTDLKKEQASIEKNVLVLQEEISEVRSIVDDYHVQSMTPQERDALMQQVWDPILKSFKSIQQLGGWTRMSEDGMKSGVFIQM